MHTSSARYATSAVLILSCRWEPPEPTGHLLPLEELRNKIEAANKEHARKGNVKISGRTMYVCTFGRTVCPAYRVVYRCSIVCHTLPYTCSLVKSGSSGIGSQTTGTHPSNVEVQAAPGPGDPAPINKPTIAADASLPVDDKAKEGPLSPATKLYNKAKDFIGGQSNGSDAHWVLKPRRVHAALNSGVKSLAETSKIVMTGWLGDVVDVTGEKIGSGSLSQEKRQQLEQGFQEVSLEDDDTGIRCVPVWMEDSTASSFYNDYCKSFLWPTFHYLGLPDHQDKEKQERAWKAYYEANVAYAEKVAELYQEGDLVSLYNDASNTPTDARHDRFGFRTTTSC